VKINHACATFLAAIVLACPAWGRSGGELHFALHTEPKTLNPLLVADDASDTVRYMTAGVLLRLNRRTQQLQPELATSWKVLDGGRQISFKLRDGIVFSDGTPFSAEDVQFTMRQLLDPALHSPLGDSFRSGTGDAVMKIGPGNAITITFPVPVAALDRLFDEVPILSARSPLKENAALGPFVIAEYQPGSHVLLKRNPNYWKKDESGRRLPYLDSVRLDIQQNRDTEVLRFRRGEFDLLNAIDAEYFDRLSPDFPSAMRDLGPSLDGEQLWFNQVAKAPLPAYKLAWFRSMEFRRAVSAAINRADICRLVYGNHASPGVGPVSPANRIWFNQGLKTHAFDPKDALARLAKAGFTMRAGALYDSAGHPVEFSLITNSGNKQRERIAAIVQEDLARIGMKVNVVTLDFPSLIERITESFNYEAALLGMVNSDLDPNAQMNVWLSSAENHQWNPKQARPETKWEAEIDTLMQRQASAPDLKSRKEAFDRVQQIVWEQAPFLYLINRNALAAISNRVHNADPVPLRPQTFWNIERISVGPAEAAGR
jgi:peptide/nickel transport system substrate-binding protein